MTLAPFASIGQTVFACFGFGSGLLLWACASAPIIIPIGPVVEPIPLTASTARDYPQALAAIAAVMARDLKLPVGAGSVTLYPSRQSFQAGVLAESVKDVALLRQHLENPDDEDAEEQALVSARRTAASSVAVALHQRVLVNQKQLRLYPWWERVQTLAHELTHMVTKEFVGGRPAAWDRWLSEGFAEWTGHRVVDKLGGNLAGTRQDSGDDVGKAGWRQALPRLTELASGKDWLERLQTRGRFATYGQAFLAVDMLIEQKGLPSVVEYFRLFGKLNDRERNFISAFGEPVATFEEKFSQHLKRLPGG